MSRVFELARVTREFTDHFEASTELFYPTEGWSREVNDTELVLEDGWDV